MTVIGIKKSSAILLMLGAISIALIVILVAPSFTNAVTGVPRLLSHQGRLLDVNGNLLGGSGTEYCFKFSIYDQASIAGGTKLWPTGSPSAMDIVVRNGVFNSAIGDTASGGDQLDFDFESNREVYLQVQVAAQTGGTCGDETFETLSPRQRIMASGYAINAATLRGFTASQSADGNEIPVLTSGNLILGGTNPQVNATSANTLTLQGGGGTGNIQFFSSSNTLSSGGNLTLAGSVNAVHASLSGNFELSGTVSSNLNPTITNTFSLGTSSLRWSNVFAVNASVSNVLEVSTASASELIVSGQTAFGDRAAINGGLLVEDQFGNFLQVFQDNEYEVTDLTTYDDNFGEVVFYRMNPNDAINTGFYGRLEVIDIDPSNAQDFSGAQLTLRRATIDLSAYPGATVGDLTGDTITINSPNSATETVVGTNWSVNGTDSNTITGARVEVGSYGTTDTLIGVKARTLPLAGTVSESYAFYADINANATGPQNRSIGFYTFGNDSVMPSSLSYALYTDGLEWSYFGGNVGIGVLIPEAKLEVAGPASISGTTTLRGLTYTWPSTHGSSGYFLQNNGSGTLTWSSVSGFGVASDSLDFDEFVDAMTLDANMTIASGGFSFSFSDTDVEFGGTSSLSGWTFTSPSLSRTASASDIFVNIMNTAISSAQTQASLYLGNDNFALNQYGWLRYTGSGFDQGGLSEPNQLQVVQRNSGSLLLHSYGDIVFGAGGGITSLANERMRLVSGNLGIGITGPITPDAKLDVEGNILASTSGNVGITLKSTTSDDSSFTIRTVGASDRLDIIGSASQVYMSISEAGNVGINTTTPTAYLHIQGPNAAGQRFLYMNANNASVSFGSYSSGYPFIKAENSTTLPMFLISGTEDGYLNASGGNLGVGTSTPEVKLEVAGSVTASSSTVVDFLMNAYSNEDTMFTLRTTRSGGGGLARLSILSSASVELFTVASSGNIGILDTTPVEARLAIRGANAVGVPLLYMSANNASISFGGDSGGLPYMRMTNSVGSLYAHISGSSDSVINNISGNFGVADSSPEQKLSVEGNILASTSGNVDLILNSTTSDDTKFTIRSVGASSRLDILGSASQTYMSITKAGNVGIGSTAPTAPLEVVNAAGGASIYLKAGYLNAYGDGVTVGTGTDYGGGSLGVNTGVNIQPPGYLYFRSGAAGLIYADAGLDFNVSNNGADNVRWDIINNSNSRNFIINNNGTGNPVSLFDIRDQDVSWFTVHGTSGSLGLFDSTPDARLEVVASGSTFPLFMLSATAGGNGDLFKIDAGGNASLSGAFELRNTASISGATTLRGLTYTWPSTHGSSGYFLQNNGSGTLTWASVAGSGVASDSLDFDEFVDSMTLDANLTVASAGFSTTWRGNFYHMQGNVGIGTTSPDERLAVKGNIRVNGGSIYLGDGSGAFGPSPFGLYTYPIEIATTSHGGTYGSGGGISTVYVMLDSGLGAPGDVGRGGAFSAVSSDGNSALIALIEGVGGTATHMGSGTVTNLSGGNFFASNYYLGTVSTMNGVSVQLDNEGGGTVTIGSGLRVYAPYASTFTSLYGLYIEPQTAGASNWNIYSDGATTRNYFGGHASIGGNFELSGTVSSNLVPTINNSYNLGSSTNRWSSIYVSSGSFHIGRDGNEAVISYGSGSFQGLLLKPNGTTTTAFFGDAGNASISGTLGVGPSSLTAKIMVGGGGLSLLRNDGGTAGTIINSSSDVFVFSKPVVVSSGVYGNSSYSSVNENLTVGFAGSTINGTGSTGTLLTIQTSTGDLSGNILVGKVGGTTRFAFDASASLGIGDPTPDARLEVVASMSAPVLALTSFGGTDGDLFKVDYLGNASLSGAFELRNTASISGTTTLAGLTYTWPSTHGSSGYFLQNNGSGTLTWASVAGSGVASDSLDFDEFVDAMTLDATTTIASGGFKLGLDSQGYTPAALFSLGRKPFSQGYISGSSLTPTMISVVKRNTTVPVTTGLFQTIWDLPAGGGGVGGFLFANQTASSSAQNMTGSLLALTGVAEHVGTGTATGLTSVIGVSQNRNTGVVTTATSFLAQYGTQTAGGTVGTARGFVTQGIRTNGTTSSSYGFYAGRSAGGSGTIVRMAGVAVEHLTEATYNTGLLIASTSSALNIPAGNYGIYNASPYTNYFAANFGIGTRNVGSTLEVAGTASISGTTTLADLTYTWPSTHGSSGYFLQNNGSGTLTWASAASALSSLSATTEITGDGTVDMLKLTESDSDKTYGFVVRDGDFFIRAPSSSAEFSSRYSLASIASNSLGWTIGTPASPSIVGTYDTGGSAQGVQVSGRYAYVADGSSGLNIIDISNPASPTFEGSYDTPGNVSDVFIAGKYAYLADNSTGLIIVDISIPSAPRYVGGYSSANASIYVAGKHAYITHGSTFRIVDISDPTNPVLRGSLSGGFNIVDVQVSGRYAYLAHGTNIRVVDINNPSNPVLKQTLGSGTMYGSFVVGKYLYAANGSSGLRIYDNSTPGSATLVGTYNTPGTAYDVFVAGDYAYVADSTAGIQVIRISNPASPTLVGTVDTAIDAQDVFAVGNHIYIADGSGGLAVAAVGGIKTHAIAAGNIDANSLFVWDNADVGNILNIRNGLMVGAGGIMTNGFFGMTASGSETSSAAIRSDLIRATHVKGYLAGDALRFDLAASTSQEYFTGNFARFSVAGAPRFYVESSGAVLASGAAQFGAAGAPSSVSYSRFGAASTTNALSAPSDVLFSGLLEVDGQAYFDSNASVSGNLEVTGSTIFNNLAYTWPATHGTSGYFLQNNGSGTLTWAAAATGTSVASDGLDFDEFVDSMTLDANLTVASAGFTVNWMPYFASSLSPSVDDTYSLGDPTHRWRDVYVGPSSLHIGTAANSTTISYNTSTGTLNMDKRTNFSNGASFSGTAGLEFTGNASFSFVRVSEGINVGNLNMPTTAYSRFGVATTTRGLSAPQHLLVSGNLEVDGTLYADGGCTGCVASNSFDFDEFKNAMTLDAETTIAQAGNAFAFTGVGNVGIGTTNTSARLHITPLGAGDGLFLDKFDSTNGGELTINGNTKTWHLAESSGRFQIDRHAANNGAFESTDLFISTVGNVGINTTTADTKLEVVGAASASAYFGAGLADCDVANTDKLLWDSTTGRFSCGVDQSGVSLTGWELVGSIVSLYNETDQVGIGTENLNGGIKLEVAGIASISGNLYVGPVTGNIGVGTTSPGARIEVAAGGSANGLLISGATTNGLRVTPSNNANNSIFNITNAANDTSWLTVNANGQVIMNGSANVGIGNTTPQTKLDVSGTASVSNLIVANHASVSGNLETDGFASASTTFGSGLADCDTGASSKLLWDASTGLFSCGIDQTSSGGASIGTSTDLTTFTNVSSLSFAESHFELSYPAGGLVKLDWGAGGPASLSQDETVTGFWIFNNNASVTGGLEVTGVLKGGATTVSSLTATGQGSFANASVSGTFESATGKFTSLTNSTGTLTIQAHTLGGLVTGNSQNITGLNNLTFAFGSASATFEAITLKATTIGGDGVLTLSPTTRVQISGNASISSNLEIAGSSSASAVYGAGLTSCNGGSQKLLWDGGVFSCGVDQSGSGGGSLVGFREGFTGGFNNFGSISFDAGKFALDTGNSDVRLNLDWGSGGPASLSEDESVTGHWVFANHASVTGDFELTNRLKTVFASVSNALEVTTYASASKYFGGGLLDCDDTGDKLVWTASGSNGGKFSCGVDQGGGSGWSSDPGYTYLSTGTDNVGIGTSTPVQKMQIKTTGASALEYGLQLQNTSNTAGRTTGVLFSVEGTNNNGKGALVYTRTGSFGVGDFHFLQNTTGDTSNAAIGQEVLTIKNNGNVGIGSTTPSRLLDVAGSLEANSFFGSGLSDCDNATNSKLLWDLTTGQFSCGTDQSGGSTSGWQDLGASVTLLTDTDNVGIGTQNVAGAKLEVAGVASVSSLIAPNGNIGIRTTSPTSPLTVRGVAGTDFMMEVSSTSAFVNFAISRKGALLVGRPTISDRLQFGVDDGYSQFDNDPFSVTANNTSVLDSPEDLYIAGGLEVDDKAFFDSTASISGGKLELGVDDGSSTASNIYIKSYNFNNGGTELSEFPNIANSQDRNTGMWFDAFDAADDLYFTSGGVTKLWLDSSNNVGIGRWTTPNPDVLTSQLYVIGAAGQNSMFEVASSSGNTNLVVGQKGNLSVGIHASNYVGTYGPADNYSQFNNNPFNTNAGYGTVIDSPEDLFIAGGLEVDDKVFFDSTASISDDVEIGVSGGNRRLLIHAYNATGTTTPNIANAEDPDTGIWWRGYSGAAPGDTYFTQDGTTTLWLDNSGNIGMGSWTTPNPTTLVAKLQVFGTAQQPIFAVSSASGATTFAIGKTGAFAVGSGAGNQVYLYGTVDAFNQLNNAPFSVQPGRTEVGSIEDLFIAGDLEVNGVVDIGDNASISGDVEATGMFKAKNGTAALPSYVFTGSPTTGLSAATADTLAFSTAATERMRITSTGNLGLGTTTATALLTVRGLAGNNQIMSVATVSSELFSIEKNGNVLINALATPVGNVGIGTSTVTGGMLVVQGRTLTSGATMILEDSNGTDSSLFYDNGTASLSNTFEWSAGVLKMPNGSAALPPYTFSTSPTTGTFSPATNILGFSTAGTERMRIDASGNIGMGTTTTTGGRLSVSGNIAIGTTTAATAGISFGTTVGTPAIHFYQGGATLNYGFGIQSSELQSFINTGGHWSWNKGGDLQTSGTNEVMRLSTSGQVSLGTTTPNGMLTMVGANAATTTGPDISAYTTSDIYPLFHLLNYTHDNIAMMFDAYYDGAFKSSDAGSSFAIYKGGTANDKLNFYYATPTAAGSAITWQTAMNIDTTGLVSIVNASVSNNLELTAGSVFLEAATGTTSGSAKYMYWTRNTDNWTPAAIGQIYAGSGQGGRLVFSTHQSATANGRLALKERMRIDENGNVGIGTTTIGAKLDVLGDVIFREVLQVAGTATVSYSRLGTNTTTHSLAGPEQLLISSTLEVDGPAYFDAFASISGDFGPGTDNTYELGSNALRWKDIFLGPGSLNMSSTTGTGGAGANYTQAVLQFTAGSSLSLGTQAVGSGAAGSLQLRTNDLSRIYIGSSGRIGLGATSPEQFLEIGGSIFASGSGNLYLGTGYLQASGTTAAGYNRFGTGSTGHSLSGQDDVLTSGDLEVDGVLYADGGATITNLTVTGSTNISNTNITNVTNITGSGDSNFGQFIADGGSAADAAFTFEGNLGTGMYLGTGQLEFSVGGSEKVSIRSDGLYVDNTDLHVAGTYYVGSTPGVDFNCGANQYIGSADVVNGIVTGGSCTTDDIGTTDIAENFFSMDPEIEPGMLVTAYASGGLDFGVTGTLSYYQQGVVRSEGEYQSGVIGVVSTHPAFTLGSGLNEGTAEDVVPVAIAGRVPVKVTTANGAIKVGDRIAASDIPGVGMKATHSGMTVGIALEPTNLIASGSVQSVVVLISPAFWSPSIAEEMATLAETGPTVTITSEGFPLLSQMFEAIVTMFERSMNVVFENGLVQTLKGVFGEVQTDKLCVGQTCVTEEQLQQLLEMQNIAPAGTPAPSATPTPSETPTPTPDGSGGGSETPTPEVTPDVTPEPTPDVTPDPAPEATPDSTPPPEPEPTP